MTTATRPGGPHLRGRVEEWHVMQRALPRGTAAPRFARVATRVACRAWRVTAVEEPAVLVASELATVALRHAGPAPLLVRVLMTPRRLRLEVLGARLPTALADVMLTRADAGAGDSAGDEHGVSAVVLSGTCCRWGVDDDRLWAELALPG